MTMKTWAAKFERGRTSIFDEERSRRPKTKTTNEMIDYVRAIMVNDCRLTLREIAEAVYISYKYVHNI